VQKRKGKKRKKKIYMKKKDYQKAGGGDSEPGPSDVGTRGGRNLFLSMHRQKKNKKEKGKRKK